MHPCILKGNNRKTRKLLTENNLHLRQWRVAENQDRFIGNVLSRRGRFAVLFVNAAFFSPGQECIWTASNARASLIFIANCCSWKSGDSINSLEMTGLHRFSLFSLALLRACRIPGMKWCITLLCPALVVTPKAGAATRRRRTSGARGASFCETAHFCTFAAWVWLHTTSQRFV